MPCTLAPIQARKWRTLKTQADANKKWNKKGPQERRQYDEDASGKTQVIWKCLDLN